ncbi:MAG: DivIVA domain-containing protein [Bacilli bacterium]
MKKFDIVFRGYDKAQVQKSLDNIIEAYEALLIKSKATEENNKNLIEKLTYYENIENTLNRAVFTAETAGDQIKKSARTEAEVLINEAKRNSNRIINEALIKAERAQSSADALKRNVLIYKRRLKAIIETQLEVIDEIDNIDLRPYDKEDN